MIQPFYISSSTRNCFTCVFIFALVLSFSIVGNPTIDLVISSQDSGDLVLYQSKVFKVRLQNVSSSPIKEIRIEGTVSKNLHIRKTSSDAVIDDGIVTWQVSEIEAGGDYSCELEVLGAGIGTAKMQLQAKFDSHILSANREFLIDGVPAIHISSYDTEDPIIVGKETIYVVELRNEGTKHCENICLVNHIPENMELSEVLMQDDTKHKYDAKNKVVAFDAIARLDSGEKVSYKIRCKAVTEGHAKNKAIFTVDSFPKQIVDEESTQLRSDSIQGAAMHLSSYDTEDPLEVGRTTIYVVDIRNEGYDVYENVSFTVELSEELSFVSSPQQHKVEGNKIIFTQINSIESGAKNIFKIECRAIKAGLGKAKLMVNDGKETILSEEVTSIY